MINNHTMIAAKIRSRHPSSKTLCGAVLSEFRGPIDPVWFSQASSTFLLHRYKRGLKTLTTVARSLCAKLMEEADLEDAKVKACLLEVLICIASVDSEASHSFLIYLLSKHNDMITSLVLEATAVERAHFDFRLIQKYLNSHSPLVVASARYALSPELNSVTVDSFTL